MIRWEALNPVAKLQWEFIQKIFRNIKLNELYSPWSSKDSWNKLVKWERKSAMYLFCENHISCCRLLLESRWLVCTFQNREWDIFSPFSTRQEYSTIINRFGRGELVFDIVSEDIFWIQFTLEALLYEAFEEF